MIHRIALLAFAATLIAAPVFAQTPMPGMPMPMATPACASISDAALPPALAGWKTRMAVTAGASEADKAVLALGKGVDARLRPTADLKFPVAPGRAGAATSYGGLFEIMVSEAGDYQVSLGGSAWLEVTEGASLVTSTDHAMGVPCTSLKKLVVFPLKLGRHWVEITDSAAPTLAVMVSRVVK